jgi:adenine-specific DNA-methyltransferase
MTPSIPRYPSNLAQRKPERQALMARKKAESKRQIEAYRGTVSISFEPGKHQHIAVKIVDSRGIESLKVIGLSQ